MQFVYQYFNASKSFTDKLRAQMTEALTNLNTALPNSDQVAIYFPSRNEKRGLFQVTKPKPVFNTT